MIMFCFKSSCFGANCNRPQDLSNPFSSNNGFRHRILHWESTLIPRCRELTAEWKKLSWDNFRRYFLDDWRSSVMYWWLFVRIFLRNKLGWTRLQLSEEDVPCWEIACIDYRFRRRGTSLDCKTCCAWFGCLILCRIVFAKQLGWFLPFMLNFFVSRPRVP